VWAAIDDFRLAVADALPTVRADQSRDWMWSEVTDNLLDAVTGDTMVAELARQLERQVATGAITPTAAARSIVAAFLDARGG
jgi:LAO/AO transport system kinase